ncbi:MAG: c-type cytochrome domain-containing protein, partial [Verrucomicrobiota bacterium]
MQRTRLFLTLCFATISLAEAQDDLTSEQLAFFESKIRPALFDYCYRCHSQEDKIKGGLTVDSKDGLLLGGDSGEAIVPGDLEASLLWTAITWADGEYEMPPKEKMPAEVIEDFRKWILMGAPDPRVTEKAVVQSEMDIEAGKAFWSFQKPEKAALPE